MQNPNTMQKPITDTAPNILYRICKHLQRRDIKAGYGSETYMLAYHSIISYQDPWLSLGEILDDAWNCKLITDQEHDYICNHYQI